MDHILHHNYDNGANSKRLWEHVRPEIDLLHLWWSTVTGREMQVGFQILLDYPVD